MFKRIVLLTKSKKNHGYCVAGIDIETGQWVRLMKEGEPSVSAEDIRYPDGKDAEVLDCVQINIIEECRTDLQPENVAFETANIRPDDEPIVTAVIEQRLKQDYELHKFVYHNKYPKLLDAMLPSAAKDDPYSLMIIEPEKVKIIKTQYGKVLADFTWKEKKYNSFRITDIEFIDNVCAGSEEKSFELNMPLYFVISLGEPFKNPITGGIEYYKLIASIIEKEKVDRKEEPNDGFSENKFEKAKVILEKIACGYNPYTGECIAEESILNEKDTIRSLFIAVQALETVISGKSVSKKKSKKAPFAISETEKEKVVLSEIPIPITKIVANINDVINTEVMKKLGYKVVVQWLLANEYIVEKQREEQIVRYPTDKGADIGISVEKRISSSGNEYYVTVYKKAAQKLIVDNINKIIQSI